MGKYREVGGHPGQIMLRVELKQKCFCFLYFGYFKTTYGYVYKVHIQCIAFRYLNSCSSEASTTLNNSL